MDKMDVGLIAGMALLAPHLDATVANWMAIALFVGGFFMSIKEA
ncbi:hypothetical protein [Cupriavidus phytorum]|nr:hypothetical protein [Cupriavidus taiwanensis]